MGGKMKYVLLITCFLSSLAFATDEVTPVEASPKGTWLVGTGDAKVEIYDKGEELEGKIVWIKEPLDESGKPKVDKNNPDEKLRTTPLLGLVLLKGFTRGKGDKTWSGGTIYDAKSGKTYKAWFQPVEDKKLELRGYVGIPLFGRTDTWTRQE
jgi:uncharacterized protein (DUF2147 family)